MLALVILTGLKAINDDPIFECDDIPDEEYSYAPMS
jgi:hypothetical protein